VEVHGDGKGALTLFRVLERFEGATLVEASPVTGRTHQIRVHAAHAGHPIAGDDKYGDTAFDKALGAHGLRRLFLHAFSIEIPREGEGPLTVTAQLPADLQAVLASLRQRPDA
jgi:23S rRNA pseudouridine955/2504/2580 synthase